MSPAIQRLRAEIASDLRTFEARMDELAALPPLSTGPGPLAQAAVALHHGYGALESAFVRLSRALEGEVPGGADWHSAVLTSMGLEVDGVRPALLSPETLAALRRVLGFRHFFRHAYGVPLDPARVEEIRGVVLRARAHVLEDFRRIDDLLRALSASAG